MKRTKISDIARIAGVSTSTVDRVLNKRDGVRRQTVEKVNQTLDTLGYSRDRLSEILTGQKLRFIALLPKSDSTFIGKLEFHLTRAGRERKQENVNVQVRRVDLCNTKAFAGALQQIRDDKPDGVIVVPIDTAETREAINGLVKSGIPVVTLISDVPQSKRSHFIGIDNLSAGRTAANLLARFLPGSEEATATIGFVVGFHDRRDHQERRAGLEQVLAAVRPNFRVVASTATCDENAETERAVRGLIEQNPDIAGIYNVGCGNIGVGRALQACGRQDLVVIGHELTEHTRRNLVSGLYDAVVAQDYWVEADHAVQALASLCRGDENHNRLPYISIDIFIRENLP